MINKINTYINKINIHIDFVNVGFHEMYCALTNSMNFLSRSTKNILCQEYTLPRIFLLGYTENMKSTWIALAEPNRLHIVELLRDGPLTVGEIAERLRLHQPQVSKHLRILGDAGFVEVHPLANRRIYQLQAKPFEELDTWLETFKHVWETRLDTLDEYLHQLQEEQHREREKNYDRYDK